MISIIMPIYNTAKYLPTAVESVLSQTYDNWELIAVDDGSTDGSGSMMDELASGEPRIHVFHTVNRGLSAARNLGLQKMSGEVVQFLDSDDWLAPTALAETVSALKQPGVDMVIFDAFYEGMGLSFHERSTVPPGIYDAEFILEKLARISIPPYAWNKPCRSELYRDVAFPEGENWEDAATTFYPVSRARKIAVLTKPLYYYRQRNDAITKKALADKSVYQWRFLQYRKRYEFLKNEFPGIAEAAKPSLLKNGLLYYACSYRTLPEEKRKELHSCLCSGEFYPGRGGIKWKVAGFAFRFFPRTVSCFLRIWKS